LGILDLTVRLTGHVGPTSSKGGHLEKDASEGKKASGILGRLFAHLPAILLSILLIPTLWYLIKEGRRYSVIVDSISVPKRLEEVGLTGEVMAGRVAAAMQQIELRTHARLAADSLAPSGVAASAQNAAITSIELPGTHLSLKVLQETAQTVFGHPPRPGQWRHRHQRNA
jgi:hypothetical protein